MSEEAYNPASSTFTIMDGKCIGGKICPAMIACLRSIGEIKKNNRNSFHNYNFRGIDDVYNAGHKVFAENGVFVTTEILSSERESRGKNIYTLLKVKFRFTAEDGSYVESETYGEGMDTGDKSSNKAMAAAFKYAMFFTLCIPTEMIDSESDNYNQHGNNPTDNNQKPPKKEPEKTVEEINDSYAAACLFIDKHYMEESDFIDAQMKKLKMNSWDSTDKEAPDLTLAEKEAITKIGRALHKKLNPK